MNDFDQRLRKAIERGARRGEACQREARAKAMSEEELKSLHTKYQLRLSEHIERCLQSLPNHFPGFVHETIYGARGSGAACRRDDLGPGESGRPASYYSRLEMTVRPFSPLHVLELTAKGTIRNKEIYNRSNFEQLHEADPETFCELIDVWVLEYAELYAARS